MNQVKKATFAGGCFWCMVKPFDELPGIIKVEVGYTGGHKENPTYREVCEHVTGHVEAVQITYDEAFITYKELVDLFMRSIDPTDPDGQFGDRGETYQTAIFYHDAFQKSIAEQCIQELEKSGIYEKNIAVPLKPATCFYLAEEEHQHYYKKNPYHYKLYYKGSGREAYVKKYGYRNPYTKQELKEQLSEVAYRVTQEQGTEPAFRNQYHDHKEAGIYVDIVSGKPLFASTHKFDSGCGWPAFTKPIYEDAVYYEKDTSHGMHRVEVRSTSADSHLGHVFEDGPMEQGGLRYCINSAALKFVPKEKMIEEGYGAYLKYVEV